MKTLIRVVVSLVCSVFGALTISVATCDAQHRPAWVEGLCGSHVGLIWLLALPLLFGLTYAAVAKAGRPFRGYIATALLGVYGAYGIAHAIETHLWWFWITSLCALGAAIGLVARKTWAGALVWVLGLAYAGEWGYGIYLAAASGYFQRSPLGMGILSLLPGTVYLLMAGYCCYAVSQRNAPQAVTR